MKISSAKTILVAGGAGFIGSHFCDSLLKEGHRVICVDNFYSGSPQNVEFPKTNPNFIFKEHDITRPLNLNEPITEIWNLASPASPTHYQKNPIFTAETNFLGTRNLLELASQKKTRFLQASTSEVYGNPLEHPQKESYWGNVNPIGIRACYDEGKRVAETLSMDYKRHRGIHVKIIRIFNTYGPRMLPNDGRVISNFIVQALSGKPLTIYGDGSQTRSFCYIDDLIEGMKLMMASNHTGPINLGNPEEYSILNLAKKIINFTRSSSSITFQPLPTDDPGRRKPDISLAKEKLNWVPHISLDKGLSKTIDFFRHRL